MPGFATQTRFIPFTETVGIIADLLKEYDSERPTHKTYRPGIGPFGEPQIIREVALRLVRLGISAQPRRTPDLDLQGDCAIEFKIVRPFGDNGLEAENWSVNLLHPYPGNVSLIGDAIKLSKLSGYRFKALFVIGYEHNPPKIALDPLFDSIELVARTVLGLPLGKRIEGEERSSRTP